ncbi:hypothetical protein C6496_21660 [Candidatus Poribacteria bacterium]|nr:MAG: hypothetical protein C6496_21660 [Candidatus Poribacteria bacterium]
MKTTRFSILVVLLAIFTVVANTFAQDYTTLKLPEGAKARLGKGPINEIKYSPDGTRLAVASIIGIWIYDAQTGAALELIKGHTSEVFSVSFSPDGTTIATGSADGTVLLWELNPSTESDPTISDAIVSERRKEDVTRDGIVNIQDLVWVASNLRQAGSNAADVNRDGIVNIQDLVLVAGALD